MKRLRLIVSATMVILVLVLIITPSSSLAKSMVLKWTTFEPNTPGATQDAIRVMAKRVEERTEGRVTIKPYWGSVLGKATDFLKMVGGSGVADGGYIVTAYNQWEIPLLAASGLPYLTKGHRVGPLATQALFDEWPAMQDEIKKANVKLLWLLQPHAHWVGLKRPITAMDELKGEKYWASGFWQEYLKAVGIVNVPMTPPEAYDALQKGVIEGIIGMPYHTFKIFKWTDILKYLVEWPYGGQAMLCHVINLDEWNKISPKDQKAIEDVMAGMPEWYNNEVDQETAKLKAFYKKEGVREITLSKEEYAKNEKIGKDVIWTHWLETAKAKGVPAEEWLRRYQEKIKEVTR